MKKKMIDITDINSQRRLTMTDVYGLRFNDSPAVLMMALVSQCAGWFSLHFQSISIYSSAHQSDNPAVDAKPSLPFCGLDWVDRGRQTHNERGSGHRVFFAHAHNCY